MRPSLGRKMFIGFGCAVLTTIVVAAFAVMKLRELSALQETANRRAERSARVVEATAMIDKAYVIIADTVINRELGEVATRWAAIKKKITEDTAYVHEAVTLPPGTTEEREAERHGKAALEAYLRVYEAEMAPAVKASETVTPAIKAAYEKLGKLREAVVAGYSALAKSLETQAKASAATFRGEASSAMTFTITLSVLGVIVAMLLGLFISRGIVSGVGQLVQAADALAMGDVDVQVDVRSRDEVGLLAESFRSMASAQKVLAQAATAVGHGDMSVEVAPRSPRDTLGQALQGMVGSVRALNDDLQATIGKQQAGDLDAVCHPDKLEGAFAQLADGVNGALSAVTTPLLDASAVLERYAAGDLSQAMRELPGQQIVLTRSLNDIRGNLRSLVQEAHTLSSAAVEGQLGTRGNVGKFQGAYGEIVQGLNNVLNAVIAPIDEAAGVLERLAERDLTARVRGDYKGDHAKFKASLNGMADALHDAITQVADSVEQIAAASEQIASSSQSVAHGASEQASSLEETSSSLEEMSSMTKQNADNTREARSMAQATRKDAESGNRAMQEMMEAMTKIRAASEGTAQIIGDINEIAFQTNLLALNAAVEAARAGDAGRGFAVVAEEVRSLALRSKEAAKKTEELIRDSVNLADGGQAISKEVDVTLRGIVTSVAKVTDIVGEIADASQEQSRGIEQVNHAVTQMDRVTQQAAANAEESSSAAEELSSQARELWSLVGAFKTSRVAATAHGRRPPVRALAGPRSTSTGKSRGRSSGQTPSRSLGKGNGNGKATGIKLSPEEVIPLQDDPDFADF